MSDEDIIPTTNVSDLKEYPAVPFRDVKLEQYHNDTSYELEPQCLDETRMAMAITNRGELIPCCRCDDPATLGDTKFQELIAVSRIADYDSIQEILETPQWIEFEQNLRNNKGPYACWSTCRKGKEDQYKQVTKIIDPVTNKLLNEHTR